MAAADRVLDRIDAKLTRLVDHPRLGRPRPEAGGEVRGVAVPPYTLFYQPISDGIRLIRVLHGARDLPAALDAD